MKQCLFIIFLLIFAIPVTAQDRMSACGNDGNPGEISFDVDENGNLDIDGFHQQVIKFLDNSETSHALVSYLANLNLDASDIKHAQAITADITGNGVLDVLTIIHTPMLPSPRGVVVSLFTCEDSYQLSSILIFGTPEGTFVEVPNVIDLNNNGRADILLRYNEVIGMKSHGTALILEWDGSTLDMTWSAGPVYGNYGEIRLSNLNDDPTTLEFTVPYRYAYESGTATSFNEYSFVRDIETVYTWRDGDWQAGCTHFSDYDELGYGFTLLHSAEVWRACGEYQEAGRLYAQLWSGIRLLLPEWWHSVPPIVYPDNLSFEDEMEYARQIAQRYTSSFAGYRLIQLEIDAENLEEAADWLTGLLNNYSFGEQGYIYAAMAQTLLDAVKNGATLEDACIVAGEIFEQVRESGDDPGIAYLDDAPGGFYWYSGYDYGSNPDNLFDVPPNLANMIRIPICLQ